VPNAELKLASARPILVRAAGSPDAAELARLRYEFRTESDAPAEPAAEFLERSTLWMAKHLEAGSVWRCWVAVLEARLVGTLWLQLIRKLPNPNAHSEWHGYISSFYVVPAFRNQNIGSSLMTACLRACDDLSVDAVFLWPTPRSRLFSERHGFGVRDDLMERRRSSSP
jgi:GNAT superfamily N-acetyltransferase